MAEYGGGEGGGEQLQGLAEILLNEGVFAVGIVVGDLPEHRHQDLIHVLMVFRVKFGAIQPLGEVFDSLHDFFRLLGLHILQHRHIMIKDHLRRGGQQPGLQLVVGGVFVKPLVQVGENPVVQGAVILVEAQQLLIAVQRVRHADLVEQLVDIEKREGQGGFLQVSCPELRPPGEVPPQLLIGESLVGGVIAGHILVKGVIIGIEFQKLCLLEKQSAAGIPGAQAAFQGAGRLKRGGKAFPGLFGPGTDGLLPEYGGVEPLGGFLHSVGVRGPHPSVKCLVISYTIGRKQSRGGWGFLESSSQGKKGKAPEPIRF